MDILTQTDLEDFTGPTRQLTRSNIITIQNKDLLPVLGRAASALGRNNAVAILNCVLLSVVNDEMTVTANNIEMALRETIPVRSNLTGSVCVNIAMLYSIVQRLPAEAEIGLEFSASGVALKSGRTRVTLETSPTEDYPIFSEGAFRVRFEMARADLAIALERTRGFASSETTRYYLCGVHVHLVGDELTFEATTGNQLSAAKTSAPIDITKMPSIILPTYAVNEITKLIGGIGPIEVGISETKVMVKAGNTTLLTKLIDGSFPDIARVTPRGGDKTLRVDCADFLRALNLVSAVTSGQKISGVRLDMSSETFTLTSGEDTNQIVTELDKGSFDYEGDPLAIAFQIKFLVDPTKLCGQTIEFRFTDAGGPFLAMDADDRSALYVAMPYRI